MSTLFSFRLSDELKEKFDSLAEATHRSKSFLAADALDRYLQTESWQVAHIHKGIKQAEEGSFVSGEEVDRWLASWAKDSELPSPKPRGVLANESGVGRSSIRRPGANS